MAAEATAETEDAGLSSLDWLVIMAATVAVTLTLMWLIQGPPKVTEPTPDE